MTAQNRNDRSLSASRLLLIGVLILYLLFGLGFNLVIPLGEGPDEPAHFSYVQYLARQRSLPILKPRYTDNATVEAYQPPLYYLLGALLTWPVLVSDAELLFNAAPPDSGRSPHFRHVPVSAALRGSLLAWRLLRTLSLLLGLVTLLTVHQAARLVFGGPWLPLAALTYLALNPQFVYIHSLVTNDALATAAGSLLLLFIVRNASSEASISYGHAGFLLGLAALSKTSVLLLAAGLAPAVLKLARRISRSPETYWPVATRLIGIPALMAGWWFVRSRLLYGDWTGMSLSMKVVPQNHYDPSLTPVQFAVILPHLAERTLRGWWLQLGWSGYDLPKRLFNTVAFVHLGIWLAAALGFAAHQVRRGCFYWSQALHPSALRLALSGTALLAGYGYYNTLTNEAGWQARLLFPGALIASLLFVEGCRRLLPRKAPWVAVLLILLQSGLMIYVFLTIVLPVYLFSGI